jgi:hypothetical protein
VGHAACASVREGRSKTERLRTPQERRHRRPSRTSMASRAVRSAARRLGPGQANPVRRPLSPETLDRRVHLPPVECLLLHTRAVARRETIVIGASLLTPLGFFGFFLVPVWLIVAGLWLSRRRTASPEPIPS